MGLKIIRIIVLSGITTVLVSCQSIDQYYHSVPGTEECTIPYDGDITLSHGKDLENDLWHLIEDDYVVIGSVAFEDGDLSDAKFISLAKQKRASAAILFKKFARTVTGAVPVVLPSVSTSTSYHSGMVGTAMYSGTSYTTSSGTQTTYAPYSRTLYDYQCFFLRKRKVPMRFGVRFSELSGEALIRAGTRKGVMVKKVARNKPAWDADIFEGDIILVYDGKNVLGVEDMNQRIDSSSPGCHRVIILRGKEKIEKEFSLD